MFRLSLGTSDSFLDVWICIWNRIGLQNESELFLVVIVDSCKSKCLFPIMTQGFCAYTVLTSLPVERFLFGLGLTPPLSTLFGVSQNYGVRAHTPSHTQLCVVSMGPFSAEDFCCPECSCVSQLMY